MRLINAETLQFEEFFERDRPLCYYILSHRWTSDELTYKDFKKGRRKDSSGYAKVVQFCAFARSRHALLCEQTTDHIIASSDGCYVWIDTCCIDKSSSVELSEAINSMYQYYSEATECHAYLYDVTYQLSDVEAWISNTRCYYGGAEYRSELHLAAVNPDMERQLYKSSWFTRGWTLQELLAPQTVIFLNNQWEPIAHKHGSFRRSSFSQCPPQAGRCSNLLLSDLTGIERSYLDYPRSIDCASVACRMSWASKREVSRIEDEAYSLMGIFQVNMPLLYGERSKAFLRLEEEIIRRSPDQSIFAWTIPSEVFPAAASEAVSGLFATSPLHFADCASVEPCVTPELSERQPFAMTNMGLDLRLQSQMRTWGNQDDNEDEEPYFALHLHCARRREDGVKEMVRVLVQTVGLNRAGMLRIHTNPVNDTVWTDHGSSRPRKFYVKAFMPVRYMARPSRDVKRVQKE